MHSDLPAGATIRKQFRVLRGLNGVGEEGSGGPGAAASSHTQRPPCLLREALSLGPRSLQALRTTGGSPEAPRALTAEPLHLLSPLPTTPRTPFLHEFLVPSRVWLKVLPRCSDPQNTLPTLPTSPPPGCYLASAALGPPSQTLNCLWSLCAVPGAPTEGIPAKPC